jgi:hypothetical protein
MFGKRREPTALEQFSSRISVQSIHSTYCTSPAAVRLASAVSVNALYAATQMVHGIVKQSATFQKWMGGRRIEWRDAALFEAVAYVAMQLSSAITGGIVARDMVPRISEEALPRRVAEYRKCFETGIHDAVSEIEFSVVQALAHGDTPGWRTLPLALDLALTMAVQMMVKIEQVTTLDALIDVSRNLHAKGDELLREWNAAGR